MVRSSCLGCLSEDSNVRVKIAIGYAFAKKKNLLSPGFRFQGRLGFKKNEKEKNKVLI